MAAKKMAAHERLYHLTEVATLYLQGKRQHEITDAVNASRPPEKRITRQQIAYDLTVIQRAWRDAAIRDFDAKKEIELAKIDQLERTYWEAWERSCADSKVDTTKAKKDEKNGQTVEKATRIEGQVGDATYLQGVERCIKLRAQLLGLNAPIRNELTGANGAPLSGNTFDETVKIMMGVMNDAMNRPRGEDPNDAGGAATAG